MTAVTIPPYLGLLERVFDHDTSSEPQVHRGYFSNLREHESVSS